jgi:hypothetical protein
MKNFCKKLMLPVIALFCCAGSLFSQSGVINVKFIGNCGLYLTDGTSNIYIDFPYKSGAHHYMEYDKSEIDSIRENPVFIFTHKHSDHYSGKLLRKLNAKSYGPWNIPDLEQLTDSAAHFSIQAFETDHRFSFHHCSYLITWHGKKLFFSGDTETAETIATLTGMDWAFVPAWLIMDLQKKNIKADAKMFALYHIGPRDTITSDDPKILLLDKQGEVISIPF